jgi:hypothetical protein
MNVLEIRQTKLGQISKAIACSADYVENDEKHLLFMDGFEGAFGWCDNMKHDSYNQYNINGDKIVELGFEDINTLKEWVELVESLVNEKGIAEANIHSIWKFEDVMSEIKAFCQEHEVERNDVEIERE